MPNKLADSNAVRRASTSRESSCYMISTYRSSEGRGSAQSSFSHGGASFAAGLVASAAKHESLYEPQKAGVAQRQWLVGGGGVELMLLPPAPRARRLQVKRIISKAARATILTQRRKRSIRTLAVNTATRRPSAVRL
jgi:hypothetical protein